MPHSHLSKAELGRLAMSLGLAAILSTSCSAPQRKAVSEEGRKACMEEVASTMLTASQSKKQEKFRECLHTIDARLEALQQQAEHEQQEQRTILTKQQQEQSSLWASPTERLNHCKGVQEEVIQLDKDRIRAYARLVGSNTNNASTAEVEQYQRDYDEVIRELDLRIPSTMRGNWSLVPEAVERFKRCDPKDFITSSP